MKIYYDFQDNPLCSLEYAYATHASCTFGTCSDVNEAFLRLDVMLNELKGSVRKRSAEDEDRRIDILFYVEARYLRLMDERFPDNKEVARMFEDLRKRIKG